jgi:hypothetical protein
VITVSPDHDATSGLTATQRDELLRLLSDELHQAYRLLDLPMDEAMADLCRRRAQLTLGQRDHGAAGNRQVDDAQDGIDDPVDRPAIGE